MNLSKIKTVAQSGNLPYHKQYTSYAHGEEAQTWQYLLQESIANRHNAKSSLCVNHIAVLRLLCIQSLVKAGQNLIVCGDIPQWWENFVKERLYPQGIRVKHCYSDEQQRLEKCINEDSRLIYWFTRQNAGSDKEFIGDTLAQLSHIYRLPLLADAGAQPQLNQQLIPTGANLQIGSIMSSSVSWLAEYDHFSWNSGYFPEIAQQQVAAGNQLIQYMQKHWCQFFSLQLDEQLAADAWQKLMVSHVSSPKPRTVA